MLAGGQRKRSPRRRAEDQATRAKWPTDDRAPGFPFGSVCGSLVRIVTEGPWGRPDFLLPASVREAWAPQAPGHLTPGSRLSTGVTDWRDPHLGSRHKTMEGRWKGPGAQGHLQFHEAKPAKTRTGDLSGGWQEQLRKPSTEQMFAPGHVQTKRPENGTSRASPSLPRHSCGQAPGHMGAWQDAPNFPGSRATPEEQQRVPQRTAPPGRASPPGARPFEQRRKGRVLREHVTTVRQVAPGPAPGRATGGR